MYNVIYMHIMYNIYVKFLNSNARNVTLKRIKSRA